MEFQIYNKPTHARNEPKFLKIQILNRYGYVSKLSTKSSGLKEN